MHRQRPQPARAGQRRRELLMLEMVVVPMALVALVALVALADQACAR